MLLIRDRPGGVRLVRARRCRSSFSCELRQLTTTTRVVLRCCASRSVRSLRRAVCAHCAAHTFTSSGKFRKRSSRSMTSLPSSGVHRSSAASRLSSTLTSAASAEMASRKSAAVETDGSSDPWRSSTTSVATMYVGWPGADRVSAPCSLSHLERSCTTRRLYDVSTSLVSSPAVVLSVRPASQSLDERSIARHESEHSRCRPSYDCVSADRATDCRRPYSESFRSSQ
mmetsp:Transcript_42681/g.137558  ORF Transcript_42681/g.137558 Transcript_42681/m.137558 type:complete len:227 (-) Transcript_42681:273-953(-)